MDILKEKSKRPNVAVAFMRQSPLVRGALLRTEGQGEPSPPNPKCNLITPFPLPCGEIERSEMHSRVSPPKADPPLAEVRGKLRIRNKGMDINIS